MEQEKDIHYVFNKFLANIDLAICFEIGIDYISQKTSIIPVIQIILVIQIQII